MKESRFRPPSRIGYFQSQLLAADDLQDDADGETRMRGLHLRASHNTWGVALGFEVVSRSAVLLQVGPGIAYDAHGGEIISAHTLNIGPPRPPRDTNSTSWWFDLVVRRAEHMETRSGDIGCFEGVRQGEETPIWRWAYAGEAADAGRPPASIAPSVQLGIDVPLVRARVSAEPTFDAALDFTVRRQAGGKVRPHVAGDQVDRELVFDAQQDAFSASISTSAGGFSQTPFYFARVTIPALLDAQSASRGRQSVLGPFVSIRAPARTSFQLDVRFGVPGQIILLAAATRVQGLPVVLTWCGVEPTSGCPPQLELFSRLFLFRVFGGIDA